jgi:hypothetical protein
MQWYALGGPQRGIGLEELLRLPPDMVQDFLWLLKELGRYRREARALKKAKQPSPHRRGR